MYVRLDVRMESALIDEIASCTLTLPKSELSTVGHACWDLFPALDLADWSGSWS